VRDIYPTLHENPPALFHTGGDLLMLTPKQIAEYPIPEAWDTDRYVIVPFARGDEDNLYALFGEREHDREPMVAMLWEEETDGQILARTLEDFVLRTMIEAADEIDREKTDSEYRGQNAPEAYRADILRDLETIRPYLRPEYVAALEDLYHGQAGETRVSYYFQGSAPAEEMIATLLGFERLDEELDIAR
jgi:hypothetical protein